MRRAAALLAPAALAGCAVGPSYRAPVAAPVAAAPFAHASPQTVDALFEPPARWWSLYADPALDAIVEEALAHNADLRVAAANLERAQGVLREERAALFPTATLTGGATYVRGSANASSSSNAVGGGSAGGTGTTGTTGAGTGTTGTTTGTSTTGTTTLTSAKAQWLYRAGAQLSYEIDLFGRVRRSLEAARGDLAATAATRDATRVTVAAATTQAYLDACTFGRQIDVAEESLRIVRQSYDITARQVQLGAATPYELARVRVLVEQTAAQVPQLQGLREQTLTDLAVLLGRTPGQVPAAAQRCRVVPRLVRPLPVGDGVALIRRRPDIRSAERTLAADTARIGVATADLYPTITLGGPVNAVGPSFSSATSKQGVSFSLGGLISWVFPNILAARGRIDQANAQARASLAQFDGTVLTALGETERALAGYDAERRRNIALRNAEQASRRAYDLSGKRLQFGSISQLEQIDVQRDLVTTEAQLAASDAILADDQVALFRALGGGWQDAPAIDPTPRAVTGSGGVRLPPPHG